MKEKEKTASTWEKSKGQWKNKKRILSKKEKNRSSSAMETFLLSFIKKEKKKQR